MVSRRLLWKDILKSSLTALMVRAARRGYWNQLSTIFAPLPLPLKLFPLSIFSAKTNFTTNVLTKMRHVSKTIWYGKMVFFFNKKSFYFPDSVDKLSFVLLFIIGCWSAVILGNIFVVFFILFFILRRMVSLIKFSRSIPPI